MSTIRRRLHLSCALACAFLILSVLSAGAAERVLLKEEGAGYLETVDGLLILHLQGTPEEIGYQHGVLLREQIQAVYAGISRFAAEEKIPMPLVEAQIDAIVARQRKYLPESWFTEIEALARGAQIDVKQALRMNFLPELFHCSGFAIYGSATADGSLYHGRVLDYMTKAGLQDYSVIRVISRENRIPWIDVGFAGMIGSVTAMNAAQVAIGEMGGGGKGKWDGTPMTYLMRQVMETCDSVDAGVAVFANAIRTCEYYYVISDAKANDARGLVCTPEAITVIRPGEAVEQLPVAIEDAVLMSAGDRYKLLAQRVQEGHGTFTAEKAIELMSRPVSMKSNLHNVLFAPKTGDLWVAVATSDAQPAADQPYAHFNFNDLLNTRP